MKEVETKIIIDTDIGEDIDDTWALIFLLSSRFVDIKLISVTTGDVKYKAKIVAKILTLLNKILDITEKFLYNLCDIKIIK